MKARLHGLRLVCFVVVLFFAKTAFSQAQGKVVINEYMPWTSTGCGTGAEFVELLNFGPGPVNIGCYILTTGVYSVTIPPNTILYPGQFYVLAGQDFISGTCANIDSTASGVHSNLNWATCNCTNVPIPTTGDGMLVDGGSANTPLVLMDPNLNVIDAVVRSMPTEPVQTITSASVAGACTGKTFNIGSMGINYEVLGMSAGRANSFARTLDGDCNWLKDPQQSGNASNNRSGRTTDISYELSMVNPTSCYETGMGSVSIYVKHSNYAAIFPMSYILATDTNNDGQFDFSDQYKTYTDSTPPFIEIDNLPVGHFRVTVFSINGCYLKSFDFSIIPCNPGTLPVRLVYFKNAGEKDNQRQLEWLLEDVQNLQSIVVEKSTDGRKFVPEQILTHEEQRGTKQYSVSVTPASFSVYRLKITQKDGRSFYSPVLTGGGIAAPGLNRLWPNPATDILHLDLSFADSKGLAYSIYNASGNVAASGKLQEKQGETETSLSLPPSLPAGVYYLQLSGRGVAQPISFRFVKH